jgi:hypothetical protein
MNPSRKWFIPQTLLLYLMVAGPIPAETGTPSSAQSHPPANSRSQSAVKAQSSPVPKPKSPQPAKPSLDALLLRVNSYWDLLARGKKLQAMELIAPTGREEFLARQNPTFSDPRLTGLEFLGKPEEVTVTVTVKRMMPGVGTVDWPVSEKWVFLNGKWFAEVTAMTAPYGTTGLGKSQGITLSAEETERRKKRIQTELHVFGSTVDFGTVRKGKIGQSELKYSLDGTEPMDMFLADAPPGLGRSSASKGRLKPGHDQSILLRWITANYDGEVRLPFKILVRRDGVEVPYQFEMHGIAYSPASAEPAQIVFQRGETQKEFSVRNNSHSEITITSTSSETGVLQVQSLPVVLAAGGRAVLKVKTTVPVAKANYRDMLSLAFEQPVEGMTSLIIPIVLNYEKPPEKKGFLGMTQQQIDELVRKARQQPHNP